MANTFKFGNGNWAVKDGYALAYNDENNNFKPLPFDFTRASSATRVNKQGLIETVGSGKPRIDFTDNTSGHLLLEPSRTNSLTYSTLAFNGGSTPTGWSVGFGTGTFSHTETTYKGQGAVKHTQSTTGRSYLSETISLSASTTYTLRVEFDRNNSSLDDNDYIVATANMSNTFAKQWSDVDDDGILEVQFTTGTDATGELRLGFGVAGNEDGGKTIVFSMPQIEAGSYATSYIPTEGSSVTRVVENTANGGNSETIGSSTGTVFIDLKDTNTIGGSANTDVMVIKNSSNIALGLYSLFIHSTGNIRLYNVIGNTSVTLKSGDNRGQSLKIAFAYANADFVAYVNGVKTFESSSVSLQSGLDFIGLNASPNEGLTVVNEVKLYDTRLTNTELQNLTS